MKNIVMNGFRSEKENMVEERRDEWSQKWKSWKLENHTSDEGMLSQSEERLCRSIM